MDSIDSNAHIVDKLDYFYRSNRIPHLIFHGSSGSGKRTIVDNFILKIYQHDKKKIKTNVMHVNCAHGKGIKFIREELKFFAKTNIHLCSTAAQTPPSHSVMFKTIILINADFLTIDAQSALRRCIELFSYNTRFFIIVENKQKLLNPILSRFCEIYVPDNNANLHKITIERNYSTAGDETERVANALAPFLCAEAAPPTHTDLVNISARFYENGISCLDIIEWLEKTPDNLAKAATCICYDKIKSEYRSEKLLMLYILDFLFLRCDKDVKNIANI
jgi:Cdc6-like AAA superfamily ATPase